MNKIMRTLFFVLCFFQQAFACTAFQLKAKDGSWIYGRSMEFGFPLHSNIAIVPQGMDYVGTAPKGKPGIKWKTKYGFVGMNQSFAKTLVSDGMNEKGLVAALLYLPTFAEYEPYNKHKQDQTLGIWELATFLLSNCASIQEVKKILPTLLVAQQPVPDLENFIIPLHLYVADNSGKAVVIEYVKGVRNIHDNPLGVLTNSPPFDWQLIHLANYVNLSPINVPELNLNNLRIQGFGQGTGLLGLPGDYTPPSRFVRAALFSQWAEIPMSGLEGVKTAFHILNTFDIFAGIIKSHKAQKPFSTNGQRSRLDITEWIIVHDRTQLKTYFRTYDGLNIQMVDLNKIDFSGNELFEIPLSKDFVVEDVTGKSVLLQKEKNLNTESTELHRGVQFSKIGNSLIHPHG